MPRHKILVEHRVNFKLRYMLAGTDEDFAQRVQAAVERRQKFESGVLGGHPSDSQSSGYMESVDYSSDSQLDESLNGRTQLNGSENGHSQRLMNV